MSTHQTPESCLSLEEVAKTLGTTPVNVLILIKRGLLAAFEAEDGWLVDRESFAAYCNSQDGKAGPAECRSACSRAGHCGTCE